MKNLKRQEVRGAVVLPKKISILFFLFMIHTGYSEGMEYRLDRSISYDQVLKPHDFVFEKAPQNYGECAFLGNGMIGTMIWARPGEAVHFELGRNDVYSTRKMRSSRLLIGSLSLSLKSPVVSQPLHLSLHRAEASGQIKTQSGEVLWRSIIPQSSDVGLIEYQIKGKEQLEIRFDSLPPVTARQLNGYIQENFPKEAWPGKKLKVDEYGNPLLADFYKSLPEKMRIPAAEGVDGEIHWRTQFCQEGQGYAFACGTRKVGKGKFLYAYSLEALAEGEPETDAVVARVRDALQTGYEAMAAEHYRWWNTYYERTFVSIPDPVIERYYWIQIYKIASATRPDGVVLDETGPWVRPTMWDRVWWNLNIQIAYHTMISCNRLDYCNPFIEIINNSIESFKLSAAGSTDVEGALNVGRTSDIYGNTSAADKEFSNFTAAIYYYWLYCRCAGDDKQLIEKVYPLMKGAALYMMEKLEKDAQGVYHVQEDISPEYKGGPYKSTNYNLGPLVWNLNALLYLNEKHSLNASEADRWQDVLANLVPYPEGEEGLLLGEESPFVHSHRHYSHLFPFYPFRTIDMETPEGFELCRKSFARWVKPGEDGNRSWNAFAYFGAAAMSAWLGDGDSAVEYLHGGVDWTAWNTFFKPAPPAVESVICQTIAVHEMLLQSKTTRPDDFILRVFPAVPEKWSNASFDRLLAEGAFEVSAKWQDGKVAFIEIYSLAGNPCNVIAPFKEAPVLLGEREFHSRVTKNKVGQKVYTIDLKKGERVLLAAPENIKKSYHLTAGSGK
jgi:hypothetical protein